MDVWFVYYFVWPNYSSKLLDRFAHGFCKIILIFLKRLLAPRKLGFN